MGYASRYSSMSAGEKMKPPYLREDLLDTTCTYKRSSACDYVINAVKGTFEAPATPPPTSITTNLSVSISLLTT